MKYLLPLLLFFLAACSNTAPDPNTPHTAYATDNQTGILRVTVPTGWYSIQEANNTLSLANSRQAIDNYVKGFPALQTGEMAGTVSALLKSALSSDIENNPTGVANYVMNLLSRQAEGIVYSFGRPQSLTINGHDATIVEALGVDERDPNNPDDNIGIDLRLLVLDAGEGYGLFFYGAPIFELEPYLPDWQAVAESFTFEAIPQD